MKTLPIVIGACAALAFAFADSSAAQARGFGLHIGGRNLHLDIGNPHGSGYGCRQPQPYQARRAYYPAPQPRPHRTWHNTSHWDYQPSGFVPHGNHVDYVPGHYNRHREGHWDVHRGGHH